MICDDPTSRIAALCLDGPDALKTKRSPSRRIETLQELRGFSMVGRKPLPQRPDFRGLARSSKPESELAIRPDEGLLTGLANDDDSKSEDDVSMHAQATKRKRSTSPQGTTAVASAPRFPFPRTLLTMRCVCQRLPNDDLGHGCIAPRNLEATTEEARNYCSRCGPGPDDCICPCGACEPSSSD